MTDQQQKKETALCPWCGAEVFKAGICIINGSPLNSCNAWRCNTCDSYMDHFGLPISFTKIVFDIPGISQCRFGK